MIRVLRPLPEAAADAADTFASAIYVTGIVVERVN